MMPPKFSTLFDNVRDDIAAALFEFVGTGFFLLFGLGGIQAATAEKTLNETDSANIGQVLYISTSMGLSLLVSVGLFSRITAGHLNPNVSLALFLVGGLRPLRFVLFCIAQLVGAIVASAILRGLTSNSLTVNTTIRPGTNLAQAVFIEMFITAALVLAVLMLTWEKHQTTPFAPIGIGLTLFAGHLFAVYYTGAAMNAARAFGPAVVSGFPEPNHWVYWLGPFLGSLLGAVFFALLKHYSYFPATSDLEKALGDPSIAMKSGQMVHGKPRHNETMSSPDLHQKSRV